MQIPYAARSIFTGVIVDALTDPDTLAQLEDGRMITVQLAQHPAGYPGTVIVQLTPLHSSSFGTDWEGPDPTRFPARLKAAATALNKIGARGQYTLTHRSGTLTIQRRPDPACS